jgi:CcmD family protein
MSPPDRFWFLFAAYAAFWLLLASFLVRIGRRHRALERELRELAARVDRTSTPPASRTDAART